MANLLIVGGAGYIGSHCAKRAAEEGHRCFVLDNLRTGHRQFVRSAPLIHADIRDRSSLSNVFRTYAIDAVLHLAALAYVGESVTEPAAYYDVNVNGTRTLLDAMVAAGVSNLVFSSSCAVYGQPDSMPIDERTLPRPINPYGFTKLACERMIDDYARAYGLRAVKLRYFNAAGADPSAQIGEDHDPETHLIPLILDCAIGRRRSISVFGTDYETADGSAVRDYIHVCDLADAHLAAVSHLSNGGDSLCVNLGTGQGTSVRALIAAAEKVTLRSIAWIAAPRRPGDPPTLVAAPGQAAEMLGWTPKRSHVEILLEDAWRWHRTRFTG